MARLAPSPAPRRLVLAEVDSTNAEARRRAEAGETGPLWIRAERQTAGRGRRGRAWESGSGNLAATLLTATDKPPAEAAQLAFVAALAVHETACAFVPATRVRVKWPNDVLVDDRKLAGVLIESGAQPGGGLWLAVGVGVNLVSAPDDVERPATALVRHLGEGDAPPAPDAALAILAAAFERWRSVWETEGFAPIRQAWSARADLGRACVARLDRERVQGVAEALEADGALRLRLPDGAVRRITAGDVFFPDAPAKAVA